ncbi:uncharacterized protein LOC132059249 [Lycium ferocissimum]|uniref:uncharacterized protein LOC132059249 n=1 Tax=Lycium ferocissimum TaxID=112874 RepID=UPI002815B7D3|nr:uncharacterized protein LOC132059249 [Lycium ferocissimum]
MPKTENETETRWENYKERIDNYMKVAQIHLVVATLVAAATFTAGLTLPGGFDNNPGPNQGMALLIRKTAFKAFIVTNAISFVCSSGAVFSYIAMSAIDAFSKNLAAITLLYGLATFWLFFCFGSSYACICNWYICYFSTFRYCSCHCSLCPQLHLLFYDVCVHVSHEIRPLG